MQCNQHLNVKKLKLNDLPLFLQLFQEIFGQQILRTTFSHVFLLGPFPLFRESINKIKIIRNMNINTMMLNNNSHSVSLDINSLEPTLHNLIKVFEPMNKKF